MSRSAARKGLALRASPPRSPDLARRGDLLWIETQYLQPDPSQPRKDFDEDSLAELGASLADVGVLTPLRVRPPDPATGMHTITDGERRWRAGQQSGVPLFPCLVEAAEPDQAFFEAYLANLHRDALSPVDAAVGLEHIRDTLQLANDEEVAARLRKSLGWVRQMNAVLGLDPGTRTLMLERGEPVAIAVGLRPQSPAERRVTLDAITDIPSRDEKVKFISHVNEHRRAGMSIEDAIQVAGGNGHDAGASAPAPTRATRPRSGGRPPRAAIPFSWRDTGTGSRELDVTPAALATTRLASQRSATVEQWTAAVQADLAAFRESCADGDGAAELWSRIVEELSSTL